MMKEQSLWLTCIKENTSIWCRPNYFSVFVSIIFYAVFGEERRTHSDLL